MKLIYVKVNGIERFLNNELILDFRISKRVRSNIVIDELDEITESIFLPNSIPLVGVNSSGKTTILNIIHYINNFIFSSHRIEQSIYLSKKEDLSFEYIFLSQEKELYKIRAILGYENSLPILKEEKISKRKLLKKDTQKTLVEFKEKDLIYNTKDSINYNRNFLMSESIIKIGQWEKPVFYIKPIDSGTDLNTFFKDVLKNGLNINTVNIFERILKLLDPSIDSVSIKDEGNSLYVRFLKESERNVYTYESLATTLSTGTKRGAIIFFVAYLTIQNGSLLLVDELEMNLHKSLTIELISLFQSKRINKKQATLIFTTHYIELLDNFSRNDVIHLLHKDKGIYNDLLSNYVNRNDSLKSKVYLNDIIDSSPSYIKKQELRDMFHE